ncbi:unnamed protein product [Larinioides sclopetarius]|uniref:Secreted protein n=1 Tax=Larinioides sclopetarius TaxID=280406 RepID=A0AAV2A7Q1_9ARAC
MSVVSALKLMNFFLVPLFLRADIICLTKTSHCEQINSTSLFDDRYHVFRTDRDSSTSSCKRGVGVAIAIKEDTSASHVHVPQIDLECLCISVKLKIGNKLLLFVLYLPPTSDLLYFAKQPEEGSGRKVVSLLDGTKLARSNF